MGIGVGSNTFLVANIKNYYSDIILKKGYLAINPGLEIMSLVMAFMLIGNALKDELNVKN
jgi:peptide/nickel transport system permease protein